MRKSPFRAFTQASQKLDQFRPILLKKRTTSHLSFSVGLHAETAEALKIWMGHYYLVCLFVLLSSFMYLQNLRGSCPPPPLPAPLLRIPHRKSSMLDMTCITILVTAEAILRNFLQLPDMRVDTPAVHSISPPHVLTPSTLNFELCRVFLTNIVEYCLPRVCVTKCCCNVFGAKPGRAADHHC